MWRFFRFCIKNNNCPGNQSHIRLISTTCTNSEDGVDPDNDPDVFGTLGDKENLCKNGRESLASKVTKELSKGNLYSHCKSTFVYEPNRLKAVDNSLKEIQWEKYLNQRKKIFSDISNDKERKSGVLKKRSNGIKNDNGDKFTQENDITFGSLSKRSQFEDVPEDVEDLENPLEGTFGKRLTAQDYGRKMLKLCKERKLHEALNVLEIEMVTQRVTPNAYCYNVLINACGKAGYSKKAFSLFHQMKQRGLRPEKFAFTGLFNACANSPFNTTEGLNQARKLREQMKSKEIPISLITYHAMIKAFGRCGDIRTAFEIVDEMVTMNQVCTTETMSFLLQACVTDKEAGFRHALMVWRKMREQKLAPNIYSYNLLLRCVFECKAGDPKLTSQLLETPPQYLSQKKKKKSHLPNQSEEQNHGELSAENNKSGEFDSLLQNKDFVQISNSNEPINVNLEENMEMEIVHRSVVPAAEQILPNLLGKSFHQGKVIGIASLKWPQERFALLGGFSCVLENMKHDEVVPNAASFTYMLDALPKEIEAENALLRSMDRWGVTPDIIFCNKLIRRRCLRGKLDEAKEVFEVMQHHHVTPDIVTFGCLAIGCYKRQDSLNLLKDMANAGFRPGDAILSTLIKNSICSHLYAFTIELLHLMKKHNVIPNERILNDLEQCRKDIRKTFIEMEQNDKKDCLPKTRTRKEDQIAEMKLFLIEYKNWLKKSPVELKDHPWCQYGFQETNSTDVVNIA